MGRNSAPSAIAIAAMSAAMVATIVVVGGDPLAKRVWSEHKEQKIRERYATGLTPCDLSTKELLDAIDARLRQGDSRTSRVSITAFPSFAEPVGVRILEGAVVRFRLLRPEERSKPSEADPYAWIRFDTAHETRLAPPLVQSIQDTLADDIANAYAEPPQGLDGTTYYFRIANGSCAMAWSPPAQSRARAWVKLFDALLKQPEPRVTAETAAEVQRLIETLQME